MTGDTAGTRREYGIRRAELAEHARRLGFPEVDDFLYREDADRYCVRCRDLLDGEPGDLCAWCLA